MFLLFHFLLTSNMRAIPLYNLKINFEIKYFEYCSRSLVINVKYSIGSSQMNTKTMWDIFQKHIMPLQRKARQTVSVLSNDTKWEFNTNLKPETETIFWREKVKPVDKELRQAMLGVARASYWMSESSKESLPAALKEAHGSISFSHQASEKQ